MSKEVGTVTLAQMIADARKQIKSSGTDEGPMEKLTLALTKTLEDVNSSVKGVNDRISTLEKKVEDTIHDTVVEGQRTLRATIERKGGFATQDQIENIKQLIDPSGLTLEQKLTMPDRQLQKYVPADQMERVRIFQELNDDAHLLGWILASKGENPQMRSVAGPSAERYMAALQQTRTYNALQQVAKALTTSGATTGAEWIPTQFSSQLIDMKTVSLKVAANFARINIPQNTFKVPISTTDDIAFLVAENTSNDLLNESNVYPKFTPGTNNITFQAKKHAAIIVFSEEAEEDSIIPMLPFTRSQISKAMANGEERATLDGDTTATHMDNDVSAATDVRKTWLGLRKNILTMGTDVDINTFNLTNIRTMRSGMAGAFAENPEELVYITSVKGMLKMLSFPEFLTIDKYGNLATVITGEVGRLDGSPLQTSKYSRDDVAATGVNTVGGPNTFSLLYLQNRLAYWYGDRRNIRIDSARMIISGQGFVVVSGRIDFKPVYPIAANKSGALGRNFS